MKLLVCISLCMFVAVAAGSDARGVSVVLKRRASASSKHESPLNSNERAGRDLGSAGTVLPLNGGYAKDGFYYAALEVGTPPTTFDVLIDTGSSNIGLPAVGCDSCGSGGPKYSASASATAEPVLCIAAACAKCTLDTSGQPNSAGEVCDFGQPYCSPNAATSKYCGTAIAYGGGSSFLDGYLVDDTVTFAGLTINTTIVASTSQYPAASFEGDPPSGILGLAYDANACNPTCVPTLFGQLVSAGLVPSDSFGLCLDRTTGGVLDLGFIDAAKYSKQALSWVPVVQERWYNLPLLDISFNGTSIGLPASAYSYLNDQIGTFIDSGTTAMLFGPYIWQMIVSVWQTNFASLPGVSGPSGTTIFDGVCLTAEQAKHLCDFPDFTFTFRADASDNSKDGVVVLNVAADYYFVPGSAEGSMCLDAGSAAGVSAVLGDSFMGAFYIAHDRANRRVGFAPIDSCTA